LYPKADFKQAYKSGGFVELEKNLFMKYYFTSGKKFYVQRVYSKKGLNYADLYDIPEPNESTKIGEAKTQSDGFEPHWMYDPETGEKERAEKPEDHERLKALGWGHEPPVNEAKIDNYVASLAKKYNALKTIDPNSKDWKDLVKQLSNLSDADLKKVVDAKIKWASMMAEPMLKYGKFADKRHGGKISKALKKGDIDKSDANQIKGNMNPFKGRKK